MDQSINLILNEVNLDSPDTTNRRYKISYYAPNLTELRSIRGNLVTMIEAYNLTDKQIDLAKLISDTYDALRTRYYEDSAGGPLEALEASIQTAYKVQANIPPSSVELKIGALVIWGKSILYSNPANCLMGIRRANEYFELDQAGVSNQVIKNDDLIILCNPPYYQQVVTHVLREKQTMSNSEIIEHLNQVSNTTSSNDALHGLFIYVTIDRVPSEEEIIEIKFTDGKEANHPSKIKTILQKTSTVIGNLKKIGRKNTSGPGKPEPELYLRSNLPKAKNAKFMFFVLAILLLSLSLFFTYRSNQVSTQQQSLEQNFANIEESLARAEELSHLDPQQAKDFLDKASLDIGTVLGDQSDNSQIQSFEEKIKSTQESIYKIISKPAEPIDANYPELPRLLSVNEEHIVDGQNNKLIQKNSDWKTPLAADNYMNNIYLLDPGANAIWKYINIVNQTYQDPPTNYLKDRTDVTKAIDIAIDGSIYILIPDQLLKFSVGKQDDFRLNGFFPELSDRSQVTTSIDSSKIYISSEVGVLIFNKDGQYQKTLQHNLPDINELKCNANGTKIFVRSGESWFLINPE
jgi:hypothetical protein